MIYAAWLDEASYCIANGLYRSLRRVAAAAMNTYCMIFRKTWLLKSVSICLMS